jgi:tRNA A37 threonylcarbamoyladenosine dehydratase
MGERARSINPKATVVVEQCFFDASTSDRILAPGYDYVLDAIDNVTAKLHLLEECVRRGLPVVSAMGAGSRTDPTRIRVTDLSRTQKDPFAKAVRKALRHRGVETGILAVWTDEEPNALDEEVEAAFRCICPHDNDHHTCDDRHVVQGTVPWVPAMFGMMMAGTAVNRMLGRPVLSADREAPAAS